MRKDRASAAVVRGLIEWSGGTIKASGMHAGVARRWSNRDEIYETARCIVPDAHEFCDEDSVLCIIEVVDTHPIRADKAAKIGDLGWALDDAGWELLVAVYDKHGNQLCELPGKAFDLGPDYQPRTRFADVLPDVIARHAPTTRIPA